MTPKNYRFETLQVHAGQQPDPVTGARAVPIYQTSSYVFRNCDHAAARFGLEDPGEIYGRLGNPTQGVFEQRIAALEGGTAALAVAAASGMAAQYLAFSNLVEAGDNIVSTSFLYGGTFSQFKHTFARIGVEVRFAQGDDIRSIASLMDDRTKAVYLETIGNPEFNVPDFEPIVALAHKHGIAVVTDNTFGAGGFLCRPIEWGVNVVTHSATKWIGGHGTSLGGVVVDGGNFDWGNGRYPLLSEPSEGYHGFNFWKECGKTAFATRTRCEGLRDIGPCISPFNAWILLQGTETLSLRVDRHVENTKKVVEFLAGDSHVAKVNHPSLSEHPDHELYQKYFPNGGASIFTFEIKGGQEAAWKFIDHLQVFSLLANVADVKSLVVHPATTTHSQLSAEELAEQNITPSTIRLSIGTENAEDIIWDLKQAFAALDE